MKNFSFDKSPEINIIIACDFVLFRKWLKSVIQEKDTFKILSETSDPDELVFLMGKTKPDIVIINTTTNTTSLDLICENLHRKYPGIPILLFIYSTVGLSIPKLIVNGVRGIIWKENSNDELIEAIRKVAEGGIYFENPEGCKLNCHLSQKYRKEKKSGNIEEILSIRETEILRLISDGLTYKEIADKLFISPRTVETHKNNIMEKLKLRNLNELIRYAIVNNV